MEITEKSIRIFAMYFDKENEKQTIKYTIVPVGNSFHLRKGVPFDAREDTFIDQFESLTNALQTVFFELRLMEIKNGLYSDLGQDFPENIYGQLIKTWIYYYDKLNVNSFIVSGNRIKYQRPNESKETTEMYLRFCKSLVDQGNWHEPSITDFVMEEFFKREISILNEEKYGKEVFEDMCLEDFLRKHYTNFQYQIGQYLIHVDNNGKSDIITARNFKDAQNRFENHLHHEDFN